MEHLAEYLRDGYRLAQPATCPDVLYQLMAFCWAINPQHRPRAALLVEYLLGLNQNQPIHGSMASTLPHDSLILNHIPASSFLHNSASVGTDLKRLNQASHSSLMNTSTSVGGDIKGLTHQFQSHSLNPSCSLASKSCLKGLSQLAPLYSKPASLMSSEDATGNGVLTPTVYSTPSTVADDSRGQLPWRFGGSNHRILPNGAISVPPPLPPANGSLLPLRGSRPQHPLPNPVNSIIL